jgi:hypothetical protein
MKDRLESYFASLGKAERYARAQWVYINGNGRGQMPDYRNYGISYAKAEAVRLKLASMKKPH